MYKCELIRTLHRYAISVSSDEFSFIKIKDARETKSLRQYLEDFFTEVSYFDNSIYYTLVDSIDVDRDNALAAKIVENYLWELNK